MPPAAIWICKKCGGPIVTDEIYTKHRIGNLCKRCYLNQAGEYQKAYKKKVRARLPVGRQAPVKLYPGNDLKVKDEYQEPLVRYCLCCGNRLTGPGDFCDSLCHHNYDCAPKRALPSPFIAVSMPRRSR